MYAEAVLYPHYLQNCDSLQGLLGELVFQSTAYKRGMGDKHCLFLHKDSCGGYPLEASHQAASKEYPQDKFSWRNNENVNSFGEGNLIRSLIYSFPIVYKVCYYALYARVKFFSKQHIEIFLLILLKQDLTFNANCF